MMRVASASADDIPPNTAALGLRVPLMRELDGLRNIFPSFAYPAMPGASFSLPVALRFLGIPVSPILILPFLSSLLSRSNPFPFAKRFRHASLFCRAFLAALTASVSDGEGFCGTH